MTGQLMENRRATHSVSNVIHLKYNATQPRRWPEEMSEDPPE
jgi:hypothetical protein